MRKPNFIQFVKCATCLVRIAAAKADSNTTKGKASITAREILRHGHVADFWRYAVEFSGEDSAYMADCPYVGEWFDEVVDFFDCPSFVTPELVGLYNIIHRRINGDFCFVAA